MKFRLPRLPEGLLLAWILSLLLLVFSYLRVAGDANTVLFDHAAYQAVFEQPILGSRLAELIGWFAAAQLVLHLAFGTGCWVMARLTLKAFPSSAQTARALTALWFVVGTFWLLAWNAGEFHWSALGSSYNDAAKVELGGVPVYLWLTGLLAFAAAVIAGLALWNTSRVLPAPVLRRGAGWIAVPVIAASALLAWPEAKVAPAPAGKPNIIFLGIDSLRYDEMSVGKSVTHTPNLDAFLGGAMRFNDAMTPLARTFPSWMSLLTGRHPHSTGAILNLLPDEYIHRGATLPEILRGHGYRTAYAIDEVRFSNIDASYGFDETETPGIGAADFILGAASDTPLLNLVVNTDLGKWLFPYSHGNRANFKIYDPDSFVERVSEDIDYRPPMFLAAHMTLPHWPYSWRDSRGSRKVDGEIRPRFYVDAVRRADEQFGDILASLEQRGMLANAIVVAFSDHGETFGAPQDVLVPPGDAVLSEIRATPNWGHGTTVLSPHQYRIFLAMRAYGPARQWVDASARTNPVPASLEDLTPTLLDLLKIPPKEKFDGISLASELRTPSAAPGRLAHRVRFTETEFNPMNLVSMTGDLGAVNASSLEEAAQYYRVDPETDRIEMKTRFLDTLRRNRQFAAVGWTQLVGVFPQPLDNSYEFLAVDLKGGAPRHLEQAADFQANAEVAELWKRLCTRYRAIIDSGRQATRCN